MTNGPRWPLSPSFDELAAAHGFERMHGIRGGVLYRDVNGNTYDRGAVAHRLDGAPIEVRDDRDD